MQTTKFKIDYNETTEQPELICTLNTASEDVSDKLLRRFQELSQATGKKVTITRNDTAGGTSNIIFKVENT